MIYIKKMALTALITVLSFYTSDAQNSMNNTQDSIKISRISSEIERVMEEQNIPAISVGVILNGKKSFINKGNFNYEKIENIDEQSIFQIASVGKVFVGIIVNDLIQKGELDVNKPFLTYLPDKYSKEIKSKYKNITIKDLLHHRSRLPRQSIIIKRKNDEPIIYDYTSLDFEKDFEKIKLIKEDGFSYSNFGYAILGFIAEHVSGESFEELLAHLTNKYGMGSTSEFCKDKSILVTPYKECNRKEETQNWEMGKLTPPSGLYSNAFDLTNLLFTQLEQYEKGNNNDILFLTNDTREAWKNTGISYGYGLFDWGNGGFGHGGGMDGYGSEYWFNPKERVGFVLLTSSGGKWVTTLSKEINIILSEKD